jgi:hypothetical protein
MYYKANKPASQENKTHPPWLEKKCHGVVGENIHEKFCNSP